MWPERKIQMLIPEGSLGITELKTLLTELAVDFVETTYNGINAHCAENGVKVIPEIAPEVTEIVYAEGISREDVLLATAQSKGVTIFSVADFWRKFFFGERLLTVCEPNLLCEGKPLLWSILNQAGYEPSCLWVQEQQSRCVLGRGLHWVLPEKWLSEVAGVKVLDEDPYLVEDTVIVKIRNNKFDFYRVNGEENLYICSVPELKDEASDKAVCEAVKIALQLGITWTDTKEILKKSGIEIEDEWHNIIDDQTTITVFEVA